MTTRIHRIDRPFEVKSVTDNGRFVGYASVFGELDSYRDIVMPGAFKRSLKEDFADKDRHVPMLWQHNSYSPIGIYPELHEDSKGLYVEGECNMDVQQGRECHALMKQRALTGLSIGYVSNDVDWDEKNLSRKLLDVSLWEISPVTFPAGDSARAEAKNFGQLATLSDVEDYLRDAYGCSRKEAVALASRIKAIVGQSDSVNADEASLKRVKDIIQSL